MKLLLAVNLFPKFKMIILSITTKQLILLNQPFEKKDKKGIL